MNKARHLIYLIEQRLEHRGRPSPPRSIKPYVSDPYDISKEEYRAARRRVKQEFRERGRATQTKLNREILDRLLRKLSKRSYNWRHKKEILQELEKRYRRAQLDRSYGGKPGEWKAGETGQFPTRRGRPVGSVGRRRGQSGAAQGREQAAFPPSEYADQALITGPEDDEFNYLEEPSLYPELPPTAPPPRRLPPGRGVPRQKRAAPKPVPSRREPRRLPPPSRPALPRAAKRG